MVCTPATQVAINCVGAFIRTFADPNLEPNVHSKLATWRFTLLLHFGKQFGYRDQELDDPGWCHAQSMIIACQVRRMMKVVSKAGTGTLSLVRVCCTVVMNKS